MFFFSLTSRTQIFPSQCVDFGIIQLFFTLKKILKLSIRDRLISIVQFNSLVAGPFKVRASFIILGVPISAACHCLSFPSSLADFLFLTVGSCLTLLYFLSGHDAIPFFFQKNDAF